MQGTDRVDGALNFPDYDVKCSASTRRYSARWQT